MSNRREALAGEGAHVSGGVYAIDGIVLDVGIKVERLRIVQLPADEGIVGGHEPPDA
jgi:hypothetical protein